MSDEVQLATGQTARLEGGTVVVQNPKREVPHHFRLTVAHRDNPGMPVAAARATTYALLMPFLQQLEALDYVLGNIQRVEGPVPHP